MFELESELHAAIRLGDVQSVRNLVRCRENVDDVDFYGYSALHYCAVSGVPEIAKILLDVPQALSFLDRRTIFHQTPLFLSALHNHFEVFCLLLAGGADPNAIVMFHQTALHWIVRQGKYKFVKELISYGADVNWLDCFGMSPLRIHLQASMGIDITRLLIKSGADINETRLEQTSILKIALYRWRQDRLRNIRYLMKHGADVNARNFIGETALHFAARASAPAVANLLVLNYRADIMAVNKFGHTPLDIALQFGDLETITTIRSLQHIETERKMKSLGI